MAHPGSDAARRRGRITAGRRRPDQRSRRFGAAIQPATSQRVYDGDPLSPQGRAWPDLTAAAQPALDLTRTDPDGARQLLALLNMGSRNREVHEQEIAFLQNNGVPAGFLPDAAELDRLFPGRRRNGPVSR